MTTTAPLLNSRIEDRTGIVEDLDEGETGYQDRENKMEDDNSEGRSEIKECDGQEVRNLDDSGEKNSL